MIENEELLARLWLSLCENLTASSRRKLSERAGGYAALYGGFPGSVGQELSGKAMDELLRLKQAGADKLLLRLEELGIDQCFWGDKNYPELLKNIPDPPDVLFYRGTLPQGDYKAVSIVGSRRETRYGRNQAFSIARDLAAQGVVIVSGLARGIDTAAHKGALKAGGITIAVLGSGLNHIYPQENKDLAEEIAASGGAVVSELPPNTAPLAFRFPARNRIVSGLSQALLLAEAREKSGTLITVGHALDQGREVFAVPGEVDSPGSLIPNRMIREGARLCTGADDIMEDMGWIRQNQAQRQISFQAFDISDAQAPIVAALRDEDKGFEELLDLTGLDAAALSREITMLEMEGAVIALPGRLYRLYRA